MEKIAQVERAKADYLPEINCFDNCDSYDEDCINSDTFPLRCPINDKIFACCMHLKRGDDLDEYFQRRNQSEKKSQ